MGLYDRDYYREDRPGFSLGTSQSVVTNLIIINSVIFLVDTLFFKGQIAKFCEVPADVFSHPTELWKLLTAGFMHANIWHIVFNMIGLYFFGYEMESIYGRMEFLRIYLVAIVFASAVWALAQVLIYHSEVPMVGASGGVVAILVLFAQHYPNRQLLIWGIIPMPAWLLVTLFVLVDAFSAMSDSDQQGDRTAYMAHLGGAAFAFLYYQTGMNLGWLLPSRLPKFRSRPKLKIHQSPPEAEPLDDQVDRILEKIHREGEASLTTAERQTLQEASRKFQRRRQ